MSHKLTDFHQDTIALLRLIYLVPGLDQRAYAYKSLLRPLVDAKFLAYQSNGAGKVSITPEGYQFLREYKLDHFGYSKRHIAEYPAQTANTPALMKAMMEFTGTIRF